MPSGDDVRLGGGRLLPLLAAGLTARLLAVAAEGANRADAAGCSAPSDNHPQCRTTAAGYPVLRTLQATPRQHSPSPTRCAAVSTEGRARRLPSHPRREAYMLP